MSSNEALWKVRNLKKKKKKKKEAEKRIVFLFKENIAFLNVLV